MKTASLIVRYQHLDCAVNPNTQWYDLWSCACNGQCPACGTKDIEPMEWVDSTHAFARVDAESRGT
jgi:hypothetical protein